MAERFGDLLRRMRRAADLTMGQVATVLGISVVYLSDVERGNRKPFSNDRIIKIAELLKEDPAPLMEAADWERGFIEYDFRKARPIEADVVGGLVAGLARGGITDEQLQHIHEILAQEKKTDD